MALSWEPKKKLKKSVKQHFSEKFLNSSSMGNGLKVTHATACLLLLMQQHISNLVL